MIVSSIYLLHTCALGPLSNQDPTVWSYGPGEGVLQKPCGFCRILIIIWP